MDWLQAVDAPKALSNVHADILGDWYRDPWSWPELTWVVQDAPELLSARLNERGARRAVPIDVPKENFVTRPAVLLDPLDRLSYQALVDRISARLIGKLRGWAYGWRLSRTEPAPGNYVRNSSEWTLYRERLRYLAAKSRHGLATDIVSFFASIDIARLIDDVRGATGDNDLVRRLEDFLQSLQAIPGRTGLPQRCWASSVLAHFCFAPIDEFLDGRLPDSGLFSSPSPSVVRWMDDIWVFGQDSMMLRLLQMDLQELLRRRGLNMNTGKTEVLEGQELLERAREIEHSAVDGALEGDAPDLGPLQQLVDKLLARPEVASRTSLRFATTRIRSHEAYELVPAFVEAALRLPHAADHLARMLRDSEIWRELGEWYVENSRRYNHSLTWTMYHLGTMFPSDEKPSDALVQYWIEDLVKGTYRSSMYLSLRSASQRGTHRRLEPQSARQPGSLRTSTRL